MSTNSESAVAPLSAADAADVDTQRRLSPDRREVLLALALAVFSAVLAQWVVSNSPASMYISPRYPTPGDMLRYDGALALFRWDATHYLQLATEGYSYTGDPGETSNIAFAPAFPWIVRLLSAPLGLDPVVIGFIWNRLAFLTGALLVWQFMWYGFGRTAAWLSLAGLGYSAGSFAFHAYYSESTMLLALGVVLLCYRRRWYAGLIASAAFLGLTRTTAAPICLALSFWCVYWAWTQRRQAGLHPANTPWRLVAAPLALAGVALYLGLISLRFGNALTLLPAIQAQAWGRYHVEVPLWQVITAWPLWRYWCAALTHDPAWWYQPDLPTQTWSQSWWYHHRTVNLMWCTLAYLSSIYGLWRLRRDWGLALAFCGYVGLILMSNIGTSYLISTHRFFVFMLPVFIMLADAMTLLHRRRLLPVAIALCAAWLVLNLAQYVRILAYFERGVPYYF